MVYQHRMSELYDVFYAEKDYEAEVEFVQELAQRNRLGPPGPLLDLACGTGRHAKAFAERGYAVTGVDISPEMIQRARERVPGGNFHVQDAAQLETGSTYRLITFLFDSVGYLVSNDRIVEALLRLRRHLASDGIAVIEFWHAPAMLRGFDPVRVRRWERSGGQLIRLSTTSLQPMEQTATVDYSILEIDPEGRAAMSEERHVVRFFQVQEMSLLLAQAGLTAQSWHSGFGHGEVDIDTWHVLVAARRFDADAI